jgi:hypothetical protein
MKRDWIQAVQALLKLGLVATGIYLAFVYYDRWSARLPVDDRREQLLKNPDYYVFPPRSYVSDLASARKLVGKPLWVKEGYRWTYEPDDEPLRPLEKIVPTAVRQRGSEVVIDFEKGGKKSTMPIGSRAAFVVDELFFIQDPREIFKHWTEADWEKISTRQIEAGMTEYQITSAIGGGSLIPSLSSAKRRVVDYKLCMIDGIPPVRVYYDEGVAERVETLAVENGGKGR